MFDFVESLAKIAQVDCVSCRTDLFPLYEKRGYKEVKRVPLEEYILPEVLTRNGLEMVIMEKGHI